MLNVRTVEGWRTKKYRVRAKKPMKTTTLRLTEEELKDLKERAAQEGETQSSYMRNLLFP